MKIESRPAVNLFSTAF